jgi:hypothetical protein
MVGRIGVGRVGAGRSVRAQTSVAPPPSSMRAGKIVWLTSESSGRSCDESTERAEREENMEH